MRKLLLAICAAGLFACAQGSPPGTTGGDDVVEHDARRIDAREIDADITLPIDANDPPPDAEDPPPDAEDPPDPVAVTLTQSTSEAITALNGVACADGLGYTAENSYYRVFTLTSHGVTGQFTATQMRFGIEEIDAGSGTTLTVTFRLHRLTGAFNTANLVQLHSQSVVLNESLDGQIATVTLTAPVIVPAGSQLVAEVLIPDGTGAGNTFYPGTNAAGESAPSYIRAPTDGCDFDQPVTYASIGFPGVHLVMTVSGTTP